MVLPEPVWERLTDEEIKSYTRVFGSSAQIVILSFAIGFIILAIALYGAIAIFDVKTRSSVPFIPTIRFDPKGFSSNELRLYNTKSVVGGCRLREIRQVDGGPVRVLAAEKLRYAPPLANVIDPLAQPTAGGLPQGQGIQVMSWEDFYDESQMRLDTELASDNPGGGGVPSKAQESVSPDSNGGAGHGATGAPSNTTNRAQSIPSSDKDHSHKSKSQSKDQSKEHSKEQTKEQSREQTLDVDPTEGKGSAENAADPKKVSSNEKEKEKPSPNEKDKDKEKTSPIDKEKETEDKKKDPLPSPSGSKDNLKSKSKN